MANHKNFQKMTHYERWIAIGKLSHAYANSPSLFRELNKLIKVADEAGMFDDVTFFPPDEIKTETNDTP